MWAFLTSTSEIKHIGGKYAHPKGGKPNASPDTVVVIHQDRHSGMEFKALETTSDYKEITFIEP